MRAIVALLLVVSIARAESPADLEARVRFKSAESLFAAGHYESALRDYQQSYDLSHYPAIRFKIALCQDRLGRIPDALASYEQYLLEDPSSPRRVAVESRIAELKTHKPVARTPLYKKWWLWTIVGTVAAGAAVGLGVGLTVGRAASDDLPHLPTVGPGAN